jgi:hypothetical protein
MQSERTTTEKFHHEIFNNSVIARTPSIITRTSKNRVIKMLS